MITIWPKCQICKREIPEGTIHFDHPDYGPVCEYCPEFEDGRLRFVDRLDRVAKAISGVRDVCKHGEIENPIGVINCKECKPNQTNPQ